MGGTTGNMCLSPNFKPTSANSHQSKICKTMTETGPQKQIAIAPESKYTTTLYLYANRHMPHIICQYHPPTKQGSQGVRNTHRNCTLRTPPWSRIFTTGSLSFRKTRQSRNDKEPKKNIANTNTRHRPSGPTPRHNRK